VSSGPLGPCTCTHTTQPQGSGSGSEWRVTNMPLTQADGGIPTATLPYCNVPSAASKIALGDLKHSYYCTAPRIETAQTAGCLLLLTRVSPPGPGQ
jgi:hypothetical protein